ncbi:hypothetical protein F2Q69_00039111 [Brassica cretica]|uniref:Uncharacterized protein n=1 Tax=Brassica cretica TaxID=69181 RepID=A0A8S9SL97_BRACR|nr:hypothetical protein F2Q69_00039111 [Brassica cretica]
MVKAAIVRENNDDQHLELAVICSQERTPISARLGPRNVEPSSQDRVPVADRLGPTNNETMEMEPLAYTTVKQRSTRAPNTERLGHVPVENATTGDLSAKEPTLGGKRKLGRPPGSRNTTQNMGPAPESSSRKRKARAEKSPTGRKTTAPDTVRPRKVSKTAKNRRSTPRAARHLEPLPITPIVSYNNLLFSAPGV